MRWLLTMLRMPPIAWTAPGSLGAALLVLGGCSSDGDATSAPDDAMADSADAGDDSTLDDGSPGPSPDGGVVKCQLDDQSDPVALCTQKKALAALHGTAFSSASGVAASWSSTTGLADTDDAGAVLHDWHDDVGYAAAITLYLSSASLYGDSEINGILATDLMAVDALIEKELATLPDEYSGEAYAHLRSAAGGSRVECDVTDGDRLDSIADAYGRAIATQYTFSLSGAGGDAGAAGDAGGSGEAGVAAMTKAGDAGAPDSASEGAEGGPEDAMTPDFIIGRPDAGAYAYVAADVATAALALLDLAVRNPTDPRQTSWQMAAVGALDHIYRRARDGETGLYLHSLVTSDDPAQDELDESQAPSGDALLTGDTATVALALSRAQELVDDTPSLLAAVTAYPFTEHVAEALAAVNGSPSLYDGVAADAGATSTGFMEGLVPSTQTVLTTKATRDNAYLLATLHRQRIMVGTRFDTEILPMTNTLIQPEPPNTSFFSVVFRQDAYLREASRGFGIVDGGEPTPQSYESAAVVAFVDAMTELLYGRP